MAVVLGNMSTLIGLMSSDSRTSPGTLPAQDRDGSTTTTLMPRGPTSCASDSDKPSTAYVIA